MERGMMGVFWELAVALPLVLPIAFEFVLGVLFAALLVAEFVILLPPWLMVEEVLSLFGVVGVAAKDNGDIIVINPKTNTDRVVELIDCKLSDLNCMEAPFVAEKKWLNCVWNSI
jgi:hypothetical protein